jgi:hypothetical protein
MHLLIKSVILSLLKAIDWPIYLYMGRIAHYEGTEEYKAQWLDSVSTEELWLFINVANDYSDFFVSVWNVIF